MFSIAVVRSESNLCTESSGIAAAVDVDALGSIWVGKGGTGGVAPGTGFVVVAVAVLALLRVWLAMHPDVSDWRE